MLRSEIMRSVKSVGTKPEMALRKLIHGLGYRYRLHRKDLPGKPDLVFASRKRVIFMHGCFWHGHSCGRGARVPITNQQYWLGKISKNRARDRAAVRELKRMGWNVLVIWECSLRDPKLDQKIAHFLGGAPLRTQL